MSNHDKNATTQEPSELAAPFLAPSVGTEAEPLIPTAFVEESGPEPTPLLASFGKSDVSVEQLVDLPTDHEMAFARSGSRLDSSKWAKKLTALPGMALSEETVALLADTIVGVGRVVEMVRDRHLTYITTSNLVMGEACDRVPVVAVFPTTNSRVGHVSRRLLKSATQERDDQGNQLAEVCRTFASFDDMQSAVVETITATFAKGGSYQESILSGGVIEPVLVRPVRVRLEKENIEFVVFEPADGATRAICAISALLDTKDASTVSKFVLDSHFGGHVTPSADGTLHDASAEVRSNLRSAFLEKRNEYWAAIGANGGEESASSLRIRQALTVPATLVYTLETRGAAAVTYAHAMDVRVRNTHINRKDWDAAASASDLARSVVTELVELGLLSPDDEALLMADSPKKCEAALAPYGWSANDIDPALWRAVVLMKRLNEAETQRVARKVIADALGRQYIRRVTYAGVLGTLLDLPWRVSKSDSSQQASKAWAYGGALTAELFDNVWDVVFANSADLAASSDENARLTLAAAGGIALIADRFITSDARAGVADGGRIQMPYKVTFTSDLVERLSDEQNDLGRTQLGLAAASFKSLGESSSAWRQNERDRRMSARSQVLADNAKWAAQGQNHLIQAVPVYYETPAADGSGSLDAIRLMVIADFDGEAAKTGPKASPKTKPTPKSKTPMEIVLDQREHVVDAFNAAELALASLEQVANENDQPVLDRGTWDRLQKLHMALYKKLFLVEPTEPAAGGLVFEDGESFVDEDVHDHDDDVDRDLIGPAE